MTEANPIHSVTTVAGRWVRLRPPSRGDYPRFFQWRADPDMVHLWNVSRRPAMFEDFASEMEQSLRCSPAYVIIDRKSDELIGYVQSYNTSLWDRWTYVMAYVIETCRGRPHFPEAAVLPLEILFKWFPLEKVYIEMYEFAHWQHILPTMGFVEEGRAPNHFWHDGQYWALTRFALHRERWPEARERMLDILRMRQQLDEPAPANEMSTMASVPNQRA